MSTSQRGLKTEFEGRQVALLSLAFVVLLAVIWFLFLKGGGDGPEAPPAAAPLAATQSQERSEDAAEVQVPTRGPVETFEVFAPKDPFKPLTPEAGAEGDGAGAGGNDDAGTGGDGSANRNVAGHSVKLVDVFDDDGELRAQVQVDSTVYTVSEDEVFADNFQVLSISGECASMLFGDDQFTLCEGEEILK